MRKTYEWGKANYQILLKEKIVLDCKRGVACFSDFMSRGSIESYDTIKIYNIDSEPTVDYKNFFLQYVIDMYGLTGSFDDDHFEFKSLGHKIKDVLVMSTVRLLWENLGSMTPHVDTANLLFKRLRDDECPHEDKLERFCYFYKALDNHKGYFSDGHSWPPKNTLIKSCKDFKTRVDWPSVNGFFTRI
jgi:hypothetical protein